MINSYQHELSDGMLCARALMLSPKLLILDEPTSALAISVQVQILNLLADLQQEFGPSMLFVTQSQGCSARFRHPCRDAGRS